MIRLLPKLIFIASLGLALSVHAQRVLKLSSAIDLGLKNYQTIQAKRNYYNASTALKQNTKNEYLPNLIGSIQQDYGTANGQFGPLAAVGLAGAGGGLAVASSGPVSNQQSWNAVFGSLYLTSFNWEFFTFGRAQSKVKLSSTQVNRDSADLVQEKFIHSIRVSGTYLNLLISQRLVQLAQSNLKRTLAVKKTVKARAVSGLNPGVDSSLANADVSRAKLALITANNNEQQIRNLLAQYLKVQPDPFLLDTTFFERIPADFKTNASIENNPQVEFYKRRVEFSNQSAAFLQKSILPGFNFFSVLQTRGSGLNYNYLPTNTNFSKSYSDGANPTRSNYLLGVSLSWNVMSLPKIRQQVNAQRFISAAYQNEYDLISTQLQNQLILADQKIENSLQSLKEVPQQLKAASDAYIQKTTLYKNGLATIVELQQAQYSLVQAEADLHVAYITVWQALLQKSAASGDFDLFINQAK